MAVSAQLGTLSVVLDLAADGVQKGLKSTQAQLGKFKDGMNQVKTAFVENWMAMAAAVAGYVTAASTAVLLMVKSQAETYKLGQSLGMTTEAMSKLEYAAKSAGVETEQLKAAVVTLTKNLALAASTSSGPGYQALTVLGISASNAAGQLKSADVVIAQIADKFAKYADGPNKTALAVKLFGEQGAKLIPVLDKGSAGLDELYRQAEKLGIVLDSKTGKAAAKFDQTLDQLWAGTKGTVAIFTDALLPTMQVVADSFIKASNSSGAFRDVAEGTAFVIKGLVSGIAAIIANLSLLITNAVMAGRAIAAVATGDFTKAKDIMIEGAKEMSETIQNAVDLQKSLWAGVGDKDAQEKMKKDFATAGDEVQSLAEKWAILKQAQIDALSTLMGDPLTTTADKVRALEEAVKSGAITWQEFQRSMQQVKQSNDQVMDSLLSATSNALGAIFKESKGAAIAQALISTYQGITKALGSAPPPYNFALAALTAAAGFAQVANIRSTNKSGSGGGKTSTSAGSSTPTASSGAAAGGASQQTLFVQGINPGQLFTGDAVRQIAQALVDYQKDGGKVIIK